MLTKNEVNALNLSPTKKDFVQIWNELLEVSGKLSERWDPTSTNESDPGIVILKALTGIADKLNYNIDKNILEAFMPTAAQAESMRKLCEMLGYSVKYYQSAQTDVVIKYHNSDPEDEEVAALTKGLQIPKFTVITNGDQDINYFTTNEIPFQISNTTPSVSIPCMEGQIVKCESINENNVITISQITDSNRFYLPETQVAENGFFIYNIYSNKVLSDELIDGAAWERVDNLNTQVRGSRVFKFGYDSFEDRPYLEFPDDYTELFGEGIFIYYTRTSGAQGNISARTLTQLEFPTTEGWDKVATESFSVENTFAATSGANPENIKQAYRNYNKTVGTFETLVTCRDYMNKIYSMVSDVTGKPLVSNVLVTDIRNDLNRAVTICSCDDAGIFYKETPIYIGDKTSVETEVTVGVPSKEVSIEIEALKPEYRETGSSGSGWYLPDSDFKFTAAAHLISGSTAGFTLNKSGDVGVNEDSYYTITQEVEGTAKTFVTKLSKLTKTVETEEESLTDTVAVEVDTRTPLIDRFDIVLYPYKTYNQIKSDFKDIQQTYENSFTYSSAPISDINLKLNNGKFKTLAHAIKTPEEGHITSINNYLRLNATISTTSKITSEEGLIIIDRIKAALANAFNLRELDFGEEIPFDTILEIMENADSRIKVISLNTPELYTTFSVLENSDGDLVAKEYAVKSNWLSTEDAQDSGKFFRDDKGDLTATSAYFDTTKARNFYNNLAARNILAGRVSLFKLQDTFRTSFSESLYRIFAEITSDTCPNDFPNDFPDDNLNEDNPFVVYAEGDTTYTGRWFEDDKGVACTAYGKIYTPEYANSGVISDISDNNITKITTKCDIKLKMGEASDLTLASGEVVKFRAPNFTTIKTYPAYVNYHLALGTETIFTATPALSTDLFSILNANNNSSTPDQNKSWQKVLDYFNSKDTASKDTEYATSYVHTFPVSQVISAYNETIPEIDFKDQEGPVILQLENTEQLEQTYSLEQYLNYSGCVKLKNREAKLTWSPKDGETAPSSSGPNTLSIRVPDSFNVYITNMSDVNALSEATDEAITSLIGRNDAATGKSALPTECSWKITYEFECVPFVPGSLAEWETFIRTCIKHKTANSGSYKDVLSFVPKEELGVLLWRAYDDTGASVGRYTTINYEKMLSFGRGYFGLLPEVYLRGIYLIESFGAEAVVAQILNDTEYELKQGEYLYIEYTPSTTSEDGTTQNLPAVTEKLGPGTIIRPSGFDVGLTDSSMLDASSFKTVEFPTDTGSGVEQIQMYALGANEQIEVRDFARTVVDAKTFNNLAGVWIYKNFDCEILEESSSNTPTKHYTLKDGEYIFYTDKDKAELAYFTSGTQISLPSNLSIPVFEKIDISVIFDSGISEIPWKYVPLNNNEKIIFQEYQYVTLTGGDTLSKLALAYTNLTKLDETWQKVRKADYILSSDKTKTITLPVIDVYTPFEGADESSEYSNGWDACCLLELNVSSSKAQVLRQTDKINTSIELVTSASGGSGGNTLKIPQTAAEATSAQSVYFKTNLACQTASNEIAVNDVLYNPKNLSGFEVKLFNKEEPAIVKTEIGKIIPPKRYNITNLLDWPGDPIASKAASELWYNVDLEKLADRADGSEVCERALRLSPYILKDSYGLVCFYLKYATGTTGQTWIELDHHLTESDVRFFNSEDEYDTGKLYLKPGMNTIRINKSGRIFIKTSATAKGQLLFDELRLIKTETVGNRTSKGLNLDQLGYLNTLPSDIEVSGESTIVLSDENKEVLQKLYTEKALDALAKEESKIKRLPIMTSALTVNADLQNVAKAADLIRSELSSLDSSTIDAVKDNYNNVITALAQLYQVEQLLDSDEVKARLDAESTITTTLEQNGFIAAKDALIKNISSYKEALISKLQTLTVAELQDAIEFDFDELSNNIEAYINSSGLKVDDKNTAPDSFTEPLRVLSNTVQQLQTKLEADVTDNIKTHIDHAFNTEIAELQNIVENTTSADQRILFTNTLNSIRLSSSNAKLQTIARKAARIRTTLESGDITNYLTKSLGILSGMVDDIDYQVFDNLLKARDILKTTDVSVLTTELESLLESSDIELTADTISDLQKLTQSNSEDNQLTNIIDAIDDFCNGSEESSEESGEESTTPYEDVQAILKSYTAYRDWLIVEYVQTIDTTFKTADSFEQSLETAIDALNASTDNQNKDLAEKLSNVVNTRNNRLKVVNDGNTGSNLINNLISIPQVKILVLNHLAEVITAYVTAFEKITLAGNYSVYVPALSMSESEVILESFDGKMLPVCLQNTFAKNLPAITQDFSVLLQQVETDTDSMITVVKNVLPALSSFKAITDITSNTNNTNLLVFKEICKDIETIDTKSALTLTDLLERQALYGQLTHELSSSISRNELLLVAMLKALCPNAAKELFESDLSIFKNKTFKSGLLKIIVTSGLDDLSTELSDYNADIALAMFIDNFMNENYTEAASLFESEKTFAKTDVSLLKVNDREKIFKYIFEAAKILIIQQAYSKDLAICTDLETLIAAAEELVTHITKYKTWFETAFSSYDESVKAEAVTEEIKDSYELLSDTLQDYQGNLSKITDTGTIDDKELSKTIDLINTLSLEDQLLDTLRSLDEKNTFYYNLSVEDSLAIEFNENHKEDNTLMNPRFFYDVNNVNNSFVVSKIDIKYLDSGLQIARSSRLN